MFKSSGYFKGVSCPFYANGLCERPYCHFRHVRKPAASHSSAPAAYSSSHQDLHHGDKKTTESIPSYSTSPSRAHNQPRCASNDAFGNSGNARTSMLGMLGNTAKHTEWPRAQSLAQRHSSDPERGHPLSSATHKAAVYIPTNKADLASLKLAGSSVGYKPTPRGELKKIQDRAETEYFPEYLPTRGVAAPGGASNMKRSARSVDSGFMDGWSAVEGAFSDDDAGTDDGKDLTVITDTDYGSAFNEEEIEKGKKPSDLEIIEHPPVEHDCIVISSDTEDEKVAKEIIGKAEENTGSNRTVEIGDRLVHAKLEKVASQAGSIESHPSSRVGEKIVVIREKGEASTKSKTNRSKDKSRSHSDKKLKSSKDKSSASSKNKEKSTSSSCKKSSKDKHKSSSSTSKSSKHRTTDKCTSKSSSSRHKRHKHKRSSHERSDLTLKADIKAEKDNELVIKTVSREKGKLRYNGVMDAKDYESGDDIDDTAMDTLDDLNESLDLSEDNVYDECLKIFNSTKGKKPEKSTNKVTKKFSKVPTAIIEEPATMGRKRVAHYADRDTTNLRKIPRKPHTLLTPAQVMHNRFMQMKSQQKRDEGISTGGMTSGGTKRVAPEAPTVKPGSSLLKKRRLVAKTTVTIAGTAEEGKRVAHAPSANTNLFPPIHSGFGNKVPMNMRQRYLNQISDELFKLCDTEKEAFEKAQLEEKAVYERSNTKNIYLNLAINTIKRFRTVVNEKGKVATEKAGNNSPNSKPTHRVISHEAMLGGAKALKTSFTMNRSGGPASKLDFNSISGSKLYAFFEPYILTEAQLVENGFPRPDPEQPGVPKIILKDRDTQTMSVLHSNERTCVRCGTIFKISPKGIYPALDCVYHWSRAYKTKAQWVTQYRCCQGDLNTPGCSVAKYHAHEQNKFQNLSSYMTTMPCSPPADGDYGLYALDCEMIYTETGIELARVTVLDSKLDVAYETLVRPFSPILDYNTRFSGITETDMKGVTTRIYDVQAVLLSMFNSKTILLGHSLESDLMALKIIHSTVVDTSIVFPHKLGPPYKRGLKTLMAEHLNKIIQDSVDGHDSLEDAASCLELMKWKIQKELHNVHKTAVK